MKENLRVFLADGPFYGEIIRLDPPFDGGTAAPRERERNDAYMLHIPFLNARNDAAKLTNNRNKTHISVCCYFVVVMKPYDGYTCNKSNIHNKHIT